MKELFFEALERAPDERVPWLAAQEDVPEAVRQQVALQLRLYDRHPYLAPVSDAVEHEVDSVAIEQVLADPESIAHYRVLGRLGEGGMGVVYACEQTEPVRRQVAVKRIKAGMDSVAIARRFEAERQALARMSHPNIAQVFDGGVDASGRLYFAMEFVDGRPITDYCDQHRLPLEERLGLFVALCRGVEHAHRRGVLHRDIKPANALVTEVDGKPAPKIIDFGIAKAIGERLGDESLHTSHGVVMGTPDYMSPEAALGSADLDTRSDVYSLGVVLYELLTGYLPGASSARDTACAATSSSRVSRDAAANAESVRPSSRFRRTTVETRERAVVRCATEVSLFRYLRNDLDWINLCALSRDRELRYGSVGALVQDLERFLAQQPVEAGPPSVLYRMRRGLRRHRLAVASAVAVAVSLIAGAAFATSYALAAERQSSIAAASQKEAQGRLHALHDSILKWGTRAELHGLPELGAQQQKALRRDILEAASPGYGAEHDRITRDWSTRERVVRGVRELVEHVGRVEVGDDAVVKSSVASMLFSLGWRLVRQSIPDEADDVLRRALALYDDRSCFDPVLIRARVLWLENLLELGRAAEADDSATNWLDELGVRFAPQDGIAVSLYRSMRAGARMQLGRLEAAGQDLGPALLTLERLSWGSWHHLGALAHAAGLHQLQRRDKRAASARSELARVIVTRFHRSFRYCRAALSPEHQGLWDAILQMRAAAEDRDADFEGAVATFCDAVEQEKLAGTPSGLVLGHTASLIINSAGNSLGWDRDCLRNLAELAVGLLRPASPDIASASYDRTVAVLAMTFLPGTGLPEAERRRRWARIEELSREVIARPFAGSPADDFTFWGTHRVLAQCEASQGLMEVAERRFLSALEGFVEADWAHAANARITLSRLLSAWHDHEQLDRAPSVLRKAGVLRHPALRREAATWLRAVEREDLAELVLANVPAQLR